MSTHEVGIETAMELADLVTSLRELSDEELLQQGLTVEGTFDTMDDPVLIGPDAHSEFIVNLANWGKGRFYSVPNRFNLPEILLKQPTSAKL